MKIKRWAVILLLLALAAPAFAGGANVFCRVKNHSNGDIGSGKYAECYDGGVSVGLTGVSGTKSSDSPDGPNINGRVFINANSYISISTTGDNELFDPRASKTVNIVAWEGDSIADVIAQKGYYGYKSYSTTAMAATPADVTITLTTNYKADKPPLPTASAGGYNLTWDDAKGQYLVAFNISAKEGTDYLTEYDNSKWSLAVIADGGDWANAITFSGKSASVVERDPDNPYFVPGQSYLVRAQAGNNFGDSGWGNPTAFTIPAGEVPEGQQHEVTIELFKKSGDFGVNSIALPFPGPYYNEQSQSITLSTMQDLIALVQAQAKVTAIGYWDNSAQAIVGYVFDDQGVITQRKPTDLGEPQDVLLKLGRGYQITVDNDATITIRNYTK